MIDTTHAIYELTRQDVRALRNADGVTFHTYDGQAIIRAHQDNGNAATGFEQHHDIPASFGLTNYQRGPFGADGYSAYYGITAARFDTTWPTIQRRITPGCSLSLSWVRGNDNGYLKDASLHSDELHLIITRNGKDERYLVGCQVGRDNSARMIRPPW